MTGTPDTARSTQAAVIADLQQLMTELRQNVEQLTAIITDPGDPSDTAAA
jgi:hypothetical protein